MYKGAAFAIAKVCEVFFYFFSISYNLMSDNCFQIKIKIDYYYVWIIREMI